MPPMVLDRPSVSTPKASSAGLSFDTTGQLSQRIRFKETLLEYEITDHEHSDLTPSKGDTESDQDEDIQGVLELWSEVDDTPEKDLQALRSSYQKDHAVESLPPPQLRIPKSQYEGYKPPFSLAISEERLAVKELLHLKLQSRAVSPGDPEDDYEEIELTNFAVYLPPSNSRYPSEMRGLQHLTTKIGHSSFVFSGVLSAAGAKRYVQGVPFEHCSIGNYGEEIHEVGSQIWLQSLSNFQSNSKVFYRLGTPASEYLRFHEGFLWLADLAKHFVDFCQACEHPVSIHDFRSDFYKWLERAHYTAPSFHTWYGKYGKEDFRHAICRNIDFLFKESVGVEGGRDLSSEPIWGEIKERDWIPLQQLKEVKTVVTPYVYDCFKDMELGKCMLSVEPSSISEIRQTQQGKALDLTLGSSRTRENESAPSPSTQVAPNSATLRSRTKSIKVGDVLSVTKDIVGSNWKDIPSRYRKPDDSWYVYVQGIHLSKRGEQSFDGIWFYKPADTSCAKMKYPFTNELFLSDNCTCGARIAEDEILDVVGVIWHGHPSEVGDKLFVRQTYLENERFVTLKEAHKRCQHMQNLRQIPTYKYPIGQTVLAYPLQRSRHGLEPYEVIEYISKGSKEIAILRRLLRRRDIDHKARPNELVFTHHIEEVALSRIERACLVRFYTEADIERRRIPAPYNRDGSGNAFYITTRLDEHTQDLIPVEQLPQTLIQGFDPLSAPPRPELRGMDLYCGGGNFGRGIEEAGAVRMVSAVDIAKNQIHTYNVNQKHPNSTKLFWGSVDDLLKEALAGNPNDSELIPLPGDIDFICAGSPCQGFSILNTKRNNEKGRKNQSLVASVASYVDFYRPKYGILENVMNMVQKGEECALSQLICAIVGMGYQLRLFLIDAWSCGSPQSRSRLFVSFAAPGLEPLEHPILSHSHPSNVTDRGLGKSANGDSFARRINEPTPFEYVTAGAATADLPVIGDGSTMQCIAVPDHVLPRGISATLRTQICAIPTRPLGMNFAKAWNEGKGVMTLEQRELFPTLTRKGKVRQNTIQSSKAWGRVNPKKLFSTIVVSLSAADGRTGSSLHWIEQRYLTTMEARRAQSFPDDELLLGTPDEGWKIMGNSVCRTVAMALGLSLRDAWLANDANNAQPPKSISGQLPVLNRAQRNRRIQVVIPAMVQENRPDPGSSGVLIAQQDHRSANETATPSSFGHNNTPNSRLAVVSKSSKGKASAPARSMSFSQARAIMITDSSAGSDDGSSKETFHRILGQLELHTPNSQDNLTQPRSDSNGNSHSRPISLKRPHSMLQQSSAILQKRMHKVARVASTSMSSSSGLSSQGPQQSSRPSLNPSTLTKKLGQIQRNRAHGKGDYLTDADDDKSSDSDAVYLETTKHAHPPESRQSSGSKGEIRPAQTTPRRNMQTPTTQQRQQMEIISLLTDDEDDMRTLPRSAGSKLPVLAKYEPVTNCEFGAYAQTNRFLKRT